MLFPGGIYPARVLSHSWTKAQSGAPGLNIKCSVADPDGDAADLFGTIYFTDASMGMARRQMKNLGFDPDTQDVFDIGKTVSLIGQDVQGGVTLEEFKGKTKIGFFGARVSAPDPAALKALTGKLRAAKKPDEPGEDFSVPPGTPAPKPAEGDDDIPF